MSGHVYKRCPCPPQRDGAGRKLTCPRPHGSCTYVASIAPDGPTPRRQHTKGGFATKRDAEQALRAFPLDVPVRRSPSRLKCQRDLPRGGGVCLMVPDQPFGLACGIPIADSRWTPSPR